MSKYRSVRTTIDGISFASKKEALRYSVLSMLQRSGDIRSLKLQPRFPLVVNGVQVCEYRADFEYVEKDHVVIEDSKGFRTPEYKLKRKLLLALFPALDHREV